MSDLISRQAAIDMFQNLAYDDWNQGVSTTWANAFAESADMIKDLPSAEPPWIPIKWHYITDEEREQEGYPKDWVVYIDCEMPCDEQEILVQTKSGYIRWDVCYEDGEFSLDSGWDWIEDIAAWRPLPEPWKGDEK